MDGKRRVSLAVKRTVDVALATIVFVTTGPVLAATAIALRVTGSPVFFRQPRPGLGGHVFYVLKFRTMRDLHDRSGRRLPDGDRLTRLGRLLRATSVDELPQLWNVLRGEMSLVGPRPLLVQYLPRYNATQARRHEVRPGITGWAQIHGRNALSWEEKFALDVWYVDNWSLSLDMKILALTALRVVQRRGIASEGHASMPEFQGSRQGS